jgi:hypothetical protein
MSVTITSSDVIAVAPELGEDGLITSAQWNMLIRLVVDFNEEAFGDANRTKDAAILYVAHLATLLYNQSEVQEAPLQSIKVGDISKTFAVKAEEAGSSDLTSTKYGTLLYAMLRMNPVRFTVA